MTLQDIVTRVRGLFKNPKQELVRSLAESGRVRAQLVPYVVVLAAIGPVVGFLSYGLIGAYQPATKLFNTTIIAATYVRAPGHQAGLAVVRYALGVSGFWFLAFMLDKLAPSFGGQSDRGGAYKTAAAIATPMWLAGALNLLVSVPFLGWLLAVGMVAALVYGVLLGMWAVTHHLGVPESKGVGLVLSAIGTTVVATGAVSWVLFWSVMLL